MIARARRAAVLAPFWVMLCAAASITAAKDHFLTIGGGYSPVGNQLSLERNVVFQQSVLNDRRTDKPAHDIFFADGDDECRDVQCRDPEFAKKCPAARQMIARLLGDADSMDLVYRNSEVANQRGPAEKAAVRRRMRELARELQPGDRLVIYVTGHGGPAAQSYREYEYTYSDDDDDEMPDPKENEFDTSFYLWDSESVEASEYTAWLDRLDPQVQVIQVMVQCYAGGFAHTIFHQADANLGLVEHQRCGFFAQMHDRGAAGCTADANEADYEEYSSYFWGALGGRTRTGETITTADYDGNGQVSFAEAHSYAVLESDTIDIPVRTSGALLRRYSHLGKSADESGEAAPSGDALGQFLGLLGSKPQTAGDKKLIEMKGAIAALLPLARPDERAILEKLPARLHLSAKPTVEELRRRMKEVESKGKVAQVELSTAMEAYSNALTRAQDEVREIWPELHADYSPLSMELAGERGDEFAERVGRLGAYQSLEKANERQEELAEKHLELAREEARLQRLLQTCENVVLAANLPQVAPAEIVARYERLVALEESSLSP